MLQVTLRFRTADGVALTQDEVQFAGQVTAELESLMNDSDFRNAIQKTSYAPAIRRVATGNDRRLVDDKNRSVTQLVAEALFAENVVLDVVLQGLPQRQFAETGVGTTETRMDIAYFRSRMSARAPRTIAALCLHEWMHSLQFVHPPPNGVKTDVPYAIQRCAERHGDNVLTKVLNAVSSALDWLLPETRRSRHGLAPDASERSCPAIEQGSVDERPL